MIIMQKLAGTGRAGAFSFDNQSNISHPVYRAAMQESSEWVSKFVSSLSTNDRTFLQKLAARKDNTCPGYDEYREMSEDDRVISKREVRAYHQPHNAGLEEQRANLARDMIKAMGNERHASYDDKGRKILGGGLAKVGVTTALGYNYYDLRGPAYLLFPVNTPFRNTIARTGRVNDGYGTAANWKACTSPAGFGASYTGAAEGQRVGFSTPNEVNYVATYKGHGTEREVSFEAQWAGEGFTDNLADEHYRGLCELQLGEEAQILLGNSGTASGNNGFLLGVANTPVATLLNLGGNIPDGTYCSCYVVELTAMGLPANGQFGYQTAPTVAAGLVPVYTRNNADGSQSVINGGMGQMSAASNVATITSSAHEQVKFTVTAKNGAFGWAWFVDTTDTSTPSLANAKLAGITTIPVFVYNQATQAGTQTANAVGLNVDHSAGSFDFDGLLTFAAANTGNATGALFTNMQNPSGGNPLAPAASSGNLTPEVGGGISQVDADLEYFWNVFQAVPNTIWASADAKTYFDQAALSGANSSVPGAYRFNIQPSGQDGIMAGFVVSAYKSRYSMNVNGGEAIPVRIHPMLPAGTIYYDVSVNPYPNSRVPAVRDMLVRRDYYSIEWPLVTRTWTFGTYVDEVLAHRMPFLCGVRTGITGVSNT